MVEVLFPKEQGEPIDFLFNYQRETRKYSHFIKL